MAILELIPLRQPSADGVHPGIDAWDAWDDADLEHLLRLRLDIRHRPRLGRADAGHLDYADLCQPRHRLADAGAGRWAGHERAIRRGEFGHLAAGLDEAAWFRHAVQARYRPGAVRSAV